MILPLITPEVQLVLVAATLLTLVAALVHGTTVKDERRRHEDLWVLNMPQLAQDEIRAWQDKYNAELERREAAEAELAAMKGRIQFARQALEGVHEISLRVVRRRAL